MAELARPNPLRWVVTAPQRLTTFYHEVAGEMRKVTWPDTGQVRQLSIGVIVLSLFIGMIIWLMDLVLQQVLVRWIPSIFGS